MQHYDLQGNWHFHDVTRVQVTSEELENFELKAGDILFNTRNSYELVGKVAIWPPKKPGCVYNNNLMRMRFPQDVLPSWVSYQMIAPEFRHSLESVKSATTSVCAIYGKNLLPQKLYIAPLREQHRIVKKIESLTTHSRKAREALDAIPPLLDQFRQSVLAAAFRGDLTADWRAENLDVESGEELLRRVEEERRIEWEKFEFNRMKARGKTPKNSKWKERYKIPEIPEVSNLPEIPSSWQWVKLSTLCIEIGDVDHKMPKAQSDGYPYISTKDFLPSGAIDLNNSKKISEEDYIKLCRKISPEKGDILLSRYGTVGEVRVVEDSQPFQASYSIAILKVVSKDLSRFIGLGLSSEILQSQIKFWSRGVAQPDLGLKHIKEFAFPVPPVAEQIEILHRAESLLDAIMNIEVAYKSNESYLAQLDQSILAKAFRGDLVPQDPTDEPANILLDRIRAEREKAQKAKKKTKRKKKS
ncbi:MAG: restriction endonuclease subunit S [Cyanobacteria bacterium J06554_11]